MALLLCVRCAPLAGLLAPARAPAPATPVSSIRRVLVAVEAEEDGVRSEVAAAPAGLAVTTLPRSPRATVGSSRPLPPCLLMGRGLFTIGAALPSAGGRARPREPVRGGGATGRRGCTSLPPSSAALSGAVAPVGSGSTTMRVREGTDDCGRRRMDGTGVACAMAPPPAGPVSASRPRPATKLPRRTACTGLGTSGAAAGLSSRAPRRAGHRQLQQQTAVQDSSCWFLGGKGGWGFVVVCYVIELNHPWQRTPRTAALTSSLYLYTATAHRET